MQGVILWGFLKCGTTSMLKYLEKKCEKHIADQSGFYPYDFKGKISRREWCYLPHEEQVKRFKFQFGDPADWKFIFITRDPVERIWSGWEAWNHYFRGYTFEEYLNIDSEEYRKRNNNKGLSYLGEVNPIKQVDYWKWITPWMEKYGSEMVEVYSLEGLLSDPDFPQTNSLKKSQIPDQCRELVEKYLKKEKKS